MKIDIVVGEGTNTAFDFTVANYPAKITFVDISGIVVEANIDINAFKLLIKQIKHRIDINKLLDEG